jgi:3D (Asp-Asp-Asp) domain-containing protein
MLRLPLPLVLWTAALVAGCGGSNPWSAEPSPGYDEEVLGPFVPPDERRAELSERYRVRYIGRERPENPAENPEVVAERIALSRTEGEVLGTFRNTYYDFPSESEYGGSEKREVFDASCKAISSVPKGFHDTLCVQGSGLLLDGTPVSFAKRDCSCAHTCPATKQKICFEALDRRAFPWGRGALGKPITPLLTVAVDSDVIPLETPLYIPEYEGLPVDASKQAYHDGCFIAQDRGSQVKGEHVDIFTGEPAITRLWNRLVPTNKGVTVVKNSPKCARVNVR